MSRGAYQSIDPATGIPGCAYEFEADIATVLDRTWAGYRSWSAQTVAARAEILRSVGAAFADQQDELADAMRREMGKPLIEGRAEARYCQSIFEYYADHGPGMIADQNIPCRTDGSAVLQFRPLGPLLGIMPWNYPCYQVSRFAAPNLLLGNTIVIKHAESTPASAALLERLMESAGVIGGAYVNVFATHEQIDSIIADDRIRGVSLTGSERAGSAVAATAGRHLKKCVLELGGSDAFIVLDTDDVAASAELAWSTRLYNNGQSCNSNKRLIVNESIHDEFVERLEELANEAGQQHYPPMSSRAAVESLDEQVRRAVQDGARLVGGTVADNCSSYFAPAVLSGVHDEMRIHTEELFGPVAVVYRASDDAHAISIANDSPFGLGAAVFSRDTPRAEAVAEALDVGMVSVNSAGADGPDIPFGGVKRSGFGRELGAAGLSEFANRRLFHRA